MRSILFYTWAGITHVGTLLTAAAFFYFPVYLDASADPEPESPPMLAVALLLFVGPIQGVLWSRPAGALGRKVWPETLAYPIRVWLLNLSLWTLFLLWDPGGRVVWDAGPMWARPLYFAYWVAAGFAAFGLARGGIGYRTGCAHILRHLHELSPGAPQDFPSPRSTAARAALASACASLWITPLMTQDRLAWASVMGVLELILLFHGPRSRT